MYVYTAYREFRYVHMHEHLNMEIYNHPVRGSDLCDEKLELELELYK